MENHTMRKLTATIQQQIAAKVADPAERKLVGTAYRNSDLDLDACIQTVQAGTDALSTDATSKPVSTKVKGSAAKKAAEAKAAKEAEAAAKPVKLPRLGQRQLFTTLCENHGWKVEGIAALDPSVPAPNWKRNGGTPTDGIKATSPTGQVILASYFLARDGVFTRMDAAYLLPNGTGTMKRLPTCYQQNQAVILDSAEVPPADPARKHNLDAEVVTA